MGRYVYITEQDLKTMRQVADAEVNEVLQEALQYDETLMMTESCRLERKNVLSKWKKVPVFRVYHEQFSVTGKRAFQARQQLSASGDKAIVIAYLYGIINGAAHMKDKMQD